MVATELLGPPVRVLTSEIAVDKTDLVKLAYARSQRMSSSTYGRSGIETNLAGAHGEYATLRWMGAAGFEPKALFDADWDQGDIRTTKGMMAEVKTSRPDWWTREGAMITASQLRTISKYHVIVWCVTGPKLPSNATYLMGWISVAELFPLAVPSLASGRPAVHIPRLLDMSELRSWESCHQEDFRWSLSPKTFGCPRSSAHSGPMRTCLQCWWQDLGGPPNVRVSDSSYHLDWCAELGQHHREIMAADAILQARPCSCVIHWLAAEAA